MSSSNAIEKTVERDLKNILDAALVLGADGSPITVYVGRQKGSFVCPSATIFAVPVPEEDLYGAAATNVPGGYYQVPVMVTVSTQKDEDPDANEFHSILSQIRDTIVNTDILATMNAASTKATYYTLFHGRQGQPGESPIRDVDLSFSFIVAPTADATPKPGWRGLISPNYSDEFDAVVQASVTTSTTTTTTTTTTTGA